MKVLDKLTLKSLKLNKKRTIVTIIGIVLSTALICAVFGMVSSFRNTLIQNTINNTGYYHLKITTTRDNLDTLRNNRDIKDFIIVNKIGYSKLEQSQNEFKPYLLLYSFDSADSINLLSFQLLEGRYPLNSDEVVISKSILTNGKVNLKVGDKIVLNLGKRYACGEEITSGKYLKIDNDIEADCHSENFQVDNTKEVTITGIIERPHYDFEPYNEAGYTVITTGLISNNVDLYLSLTNPRDYEQSFKEILGIKTSGYINEDTSLLYPNYEINNELLRWEVLKFSNDTMNMLFTIAIVVVIIIIITSVYCIRNSFAISQIEKTKMFGMLASIGATKKQIKKSVLKEGFYLGIIGIPIGILCGIIADYILVIILNKIGGKFLFNNNSFIFSISWFAIIMAITLGIVTIYLSAISQARRASKITPIEAIRNNNEIKISPRKISCPSFIQKIFGIGGVVAYKNLKRSKKKYRTTIISIAVSIFTFISLNSFITYGFKLTSVYYENYNYDLMICPKNQQEFPIDKILSLENIQSSNIIYNTNKYLTINDLTKLTNFGYQILTQNYLDESDQIPNELALNIIGLNDEDFKDYLKSNHLTSTKYSKEAIIFDKYLYYDTIAKKNIEKNSLNYHSNDIIKGKIDNQEYTFQVIDSLETTPEGLEHTYSYPGSLILNTKYYEELGFYPSMLTIKSNNIDQFIYELDKLGLDIYYHNYKAQADNEHSMVLIFSIFLYGFITVISLIGVTNIFNTITANVKLRQKEFAIFKSIGMTKKEFNRIINLETLFYCLKSLFYGIILGLIGSYAIYKAFASNYDAGFIWPISAIVISCLTVVILVFIIMHYSINKINKQNIIETIRNENI